MKAVLDANVIISSLLSPGESISTIMKHWKNNAFSLISSNQILDEINQVLQRLTQKGFLAKQEVDKFMNKLTKKSTIINTVTNLDIVIDKKDNRYLACAKDSKAQYLVSGDKKHLLHLKRFKYTKIVSPSEFAQILENLVNKIK